MAQFLVVQTGKTVWEQEGRLDSLAGSPLSEEGREAAGNIAEAMKVFSPTLAFASEGQAEVEMVKLIADAGSLKVHCENGLGEIDYGIWQGLKTEEIKRRQPRLQKQWMEAPSGVRPPGGESLVEAQDRVWQTVFTLLKKHKDEVAVLIMRPVILGLFRCRVFGAEIDEIWKYVRRDPGWSMMAAKISKKEMVVTEETIEDDRE